MRAYLLFVLIACDSGGKAVQQNAPNAPVQITMTHTDPSDPQAWAEAQQIAAQQHAGAVKKRSDALPFLFQGDRSKSVLIHRGAVITARGPVVAGAYLRDLGIAQNKGPKLEDVLWTLWALDALPDVAPMAPEGYVNRAGDKRLEDLTARIEWDGKSAHIVLHYFKPEAKPPANVNVSGGADVQQGTGVGGRVGGSTVREIVRMTLDIPEKGDAKWRREDLNWADPG